MKKLFLFLVWGFCIALLSADSMSSLRTKEWLSFFSYPIPLEIVNHIVRKCAHVLEYFVLAYLFTKVLQEFMKNNFHVLTLTFLNMLTFAVVDETFQKLIPGRSGRGYDVIIDSMGILLALLFYQKTTKKHKKMIVGG